MSAEALNADVAIVGAGTAGAAAALQCARAGLAVICVERRALSEAGARWVNAVPGWCFDEAGIERPSGEELRAQGRAFHLVSGWGPRRISVHNHGVLEVDMRLLASRLHELARRAGVRFIDGAEIVGFGPELETTRGAVKARHYVDASGVAGAKLLPRARRVALCAAAQEVRRVTDWPRARAFFRTRGVEPGETLAFSSVAGGFSVVSVRLEDEFVSLLTGSIPADGHASGQGLLRQFVERETWVGETVFGGARAIPLGRPCDRLVSDRVLLLGDSACQVFAAHGSGIGAGLIAARVLAEALAREGDAHAYARSWQRRYGGLFAAYDVFRRFAQGLAPADVELLMASGVLDEAAARAGLAQRWPALDLQSLPRRIGALSRHPGLAKRLAPVAARMMGAAALYARYPRDAARVPAWSHTAARWLEPGGSASKN